MKQIIAYIRPAVLERVTEALRSLGGLTGMSVMEIKGFGQGKGFGRRSVHDEDITYFRDNVRVELMAADAVAGQVVKTIREQAWTGERGEGKIYVLNVEEAVRIGTNERGTAAV